MKIFVTLCVLFSGLLSSGTVSASAVGFSGVVTAGGGGTAILGTIPANPVRPFTLVLNFKRWCRVYELLG